MTLSVRHALECDIPDAAVTPELPDGAVRPSDWNDEHVLTQSSAGVLGRTSAGAVGILAFNDIPAEIGLEIGVDVQAWDAQLDSLSAASANGVSLVTAADYAAMRALLDLEAGTDFLSPAAIAAAYQPIDSDLTAIAALSTASYGRSLLTLANAAALASEIDSFFLTPSEGNAAYQPIDADLTAIGALAKADGNIIVGDGATWVAESGNTARTSLGLGTGDSPTFTGLTLTGVLTDVAGGAIFNEAGANVDFRIEGDTLTHLFFLDASADSIGINDSAPTSIVTVKANSITGPHIDVWCDDGVRQPDIAATGYGAAGGGIFHSKRARGTKASPTQLLAGDEIGGYGGRPYTSGGSFTPSSPASLHFVAAEDQTATNNAAYFRVLTTPLAATYADRKVRCIFTHDGVVWAIDEGTHNPLVPRQTKPWTDARFLASGEDASGQTGASVGAVMFGGSNARTAGFRGGTARGTAASPTATQADDFLVFLGGHGYETTTPGFSSSSRGLFGIKAAEAYTNTAQGTYAVIETTPTGSTTRAERVRVTDTAATSLVNVIAPNLQQQVRISGVNFNSADTDNAVTVVLPTGFSRFRIGGIAISGASASLTTSTFGVFTSTGGGGTAVIASGTANTVSTASESTTNNMQFVTPANVNTASYNNTTLYFRVQTAQGSAATASVTIFYQPVS